MDIENKKEEQPNTIENPQDSSEKQPINEPTVSEVSSFFNEEKDNEEDKIFSKINFSDTTIEKSTIAGTIEHLEVHYGTEKSIPKFNEVTCNDLGELTFRVESVSQIYTSLVLKDKILILNCAYHDIALNLKYAMAQSDVFATYKKIEIASEETNSSKISYLVDSTRKGLKLKENEKLLLFIHDNNEEEIPPLLAAIKKKTQNGKSSILSHLKENTFIIYITYHKDVNYLNTSLFDFHTVDVFDIYTSTYNFSETDIVLLKQQQGRGFWSVDIKKLLLDLDKVKPNFTREISRRSNEPPTEFLPIIKNKQQPIARYVLFVASFFPELTPGKFREFVSLLLSDKKTLQGEKEVLLRSIWEDNADEIIDDCKLETYKKNNQYYVDFASSTESERCEEILFNKVINFVDQQARYLIDEQKLFTSESTVKDHNKVFPVIARLANSFKDYYGDELLKKWLFLIELQQDKCDECTSMIDDLKSYKNKIRRLINTLKKFQFTSQSLQTLRDIAAIHVDKKYDDLLENIHHAKFFFYKAELLSEDFSVNDIINELSDAYELIVEELNNINAEKNRGNYYVRRNIKSFVDLLLKIQKEDVYNEVVSEFFEATFKVIYHNYIVLQVLNEFHIKSKTPSFYSHYKFCLSHADKKISEKSIISFITYMIQDPSEFYSSLKVISNWLPETTKSKERYTQLENNIIQCICTSLFVFVDNDQQYIQDKNITASPSYCALFENVEGMKSFIEITVNILLNIYHGEEKSIKEALKYIEYWYFILKEANELEDDLAEIDQKIKLFVSTIQKVFDAKLRKKIQMLIREIRAEYNEKIGNVINREEEKMLKKKRGYLIELTTILKN